MDRRRAFLRAPVSDGACLSNDSRGACHWCAFSRRTLHMRVGPSRLPLIDVAQQSGQVPYCLISESSQDVECCLTSGLPLPHWSFQAGPQLLFRFSNQSLLMLALWSCGRRASLTWPIGGGVSDFGSS